jgi:hypothetical protein
MNAQLGSSLLQADSSQSSVHHVAHRTNGQTIMRDCAVNNLEKVSAVVGHPPFACESTAL